MPNKPADAKRAKFAILCRKIRLWLNENPGSSGFDVKLKFGKRYEKALLKMLGMGIVRCEQGLSSNGGITMVWYVVPQ